MKLLAVATHPIQYQAPWFRALAAHAELDLTVAFAFVPSPAEQGLGFGVPFEWDLPLLDGYRSLRLTLATSRPRLGSFWSLRARGLRRLLATERPDAVLLTGWNSWVLLQALNAARRRGVPTLVRGDSNDLRARHPAVRSLQRQLLARYDGALAVGRANREFLRARGVPETRIFDAPHFVDNARFAAEAAAVREDRDALRTGWGVEGDRFLFLFAGKLVDKKRPGDLLAAFAASTELHARSGLLVVGDGTLRRELEQQAAAGQLPIHFAGFLNQSEIARAYAAADCLVLPSDAGETWGLVVNEAMACGLPAVVSDRVGCAADLVTPGETGWVFPCGDVAALAAALEEAVADPARSARFGAAARRLVSERFTIERSVDAVVAAVRYVTAGRAR